MSGPNQSSSVQIINGAMSSTVTYAYVLQPKGAGKYTIGAASIEVGGMVLRTEPIDIEVVKGSGTAARRGNSRAHPGDLGKDLATTSSSERPWTGRTCCRASRST